MNPKKLLRNKQLFVNKITLGSFLFVMLQVGMIKAMETTASQI